MTNSDTSEARPPHDATLLLHNAAEGDTDAGERLLKLLYAEMHERAERLMRRERGNHTLQPTVLVHDAYMKLIDQDRAQWQDRSHFLAMAAQTMRRILIDHARAKKRMKREGKHARADLGDMEPAAEVEADILDVDEALTKLAAIDAQRARVVELRYFGGLSMPQIAEVLDVPLRTVERNWQAAKAWLHVELSQS